MSNKGIYGYQFKPTKEQKLILKTLKEQGPLEGTFYELRGRIAYPPKGWFVSDLIALKMHKYITLEDLPERRRRIALREENTSNGE